jgi:predicted transcriptional regulator
MRRPASIGQAELEVLRYIADQPSVTVGEAAEHFAGARGYARTTVQAMMERLREKGFLQRRKLRGVYHYSPRVPQEDLLRRLVREFVAHTLGGSLTPFVAYLSQEAHLRDEELEELKRLVEELETQRKEPAP